MTQYSLTQTLRDAAIILVASAGFALASNGMRPNHIPFVQREPYEIFKPCADPSGEVTELDPRDPLIYVRNTLLVDARSRDEFASWHLQGALSLPYDYLTPTSDSQVQALANSRSARVVIYGDGDNPDSGHELGKELSGKGIRNVHFVRGGAPSLRTAQQPTEVQ